MSNAPRAARSAADRRGARLVAAPLLAGVCAWLAALLLAAAAAYAQVPVPKLSARVTDLTGTLSAEQRQALETRLAEFEARKGAQIAVLLVPTTQPETIEQYARRVLDEWKLGRKGIDDGALLLIALKDRRLRIETQYGLEGVMPDAIAKRIIDETITPRFRQNDIYGGITAGIERMIGVVEGEPLPPPPSRTARGGERGPDLESLFMIGFALVFVVAAVLRTIFGRVGAAAITGGIGGVIAWFIVGSVVAAGVVALIVFVLSTIFGVAGAGRTMRRGGWGGYHGGGWGGGSWGGGGGWSGGGGMGGGGGASGSW